MFVNVCSHPRVDPVCGANLEPVSLEHLSTWGLGNTRVPLLVGPTRAMMDAEGRDATAVDVLFHPAVVHLALTGGKSVTREHYRDYLMDIATKNIAEDHGIVLAPGRTKPLENAKYKGPNGENKDNTHAFPVFNPDAPPMEAAGKAASEAPTMRSGPLIEEVGDDENAKPWTTETKPDRSATTAAKRPIKKGFLFPSGGTGEGKGAARGVELYPDGSAEGIPKPGEQYDPLGHLPESVRSKCHVIDTGALKGAELDKVTRQYAETGRLDTNAKGVYAKGSAPGGKPEIGIGHPSRLRGEDDVATRRETAAPKPAPKATEPTPRASRPAVPEHDISESTLGGEAAVEVRVRLPLLQDGMAAVELDVGATSLGLTSPEYALTVSLPRRVDAEGARAKFSSKRMELKVLIPVATIPGR